MTTLVSPNIIKFSDDISDASGNTVCWSRDLMWDNHNTGWTPLECKEAGRIVASAIVEQLDSEPDPTLDIASKLAIQDPPLKGLRLAMFMIGAMEVTHPPRGEG